MPLDLHVSQISGKEQNGRYRKRPNKRPKKYYCYFLEFHMTKQWWHAKRAGNKAKICFIRYYWDDLRPMKNMKLVQIRNPRCTIFLGSSMNRALEPQPIHTYEMIRERFQSSALEIVSSLSIAYDARKIT